MTASLPVVDANATAETTARRTAAATRTAVPDTGEAIRVRGLVQGVGFRPTVWKLARECGLWGDVCNDAQGVLIQAWGTPASRAIFLRRLRDEAPPLSRIDALESTPLEGRSEHRDFRITPSVAGAVHTGVVPDAATCDACVAEVVDPRDRRHGYAFTNCTHCGPRLSIVRRIPYDRAYTSMDAFPMCESCRAEYEDPGDRRFHAQPNACPDCGPRLWLETTGADGINIDGDPIDATQRLLRAGLIVAIKGIGGIHLACDATNAEAVATLRRRKQRPDKPLALMACDETMIRRYCSLDKAQAGLLGSPAAPIVLLDAVGVEQLAEGVAPGQGCYGFMLPYSPLHHLLMAGLDWPIVLTSGNRSEEPQCTDNEDARQRLADIADALLLNDREIVNRLDDSVVRMIAGTPALLRRARGYAPASLRLPPGFAEAPTVLAFGGELKNTFCLLRDGEAILSQHLGDLENAPANRAASNTLELYLQLFEHQPQVLAIDAHPEYLPSKLGKERAKATGLPLASVQHHHAHIASCLADNGIDLDAPPVLGIALDGLGYGGDGTLWGGEFLLADYRGYKRLAALAPVAMPGGTQAIRQPWRMAYAHLRRLHDWSELSTEHAALPFLQSLADKPLATFDGMIASAFNTPMTTSCGRLFDAVAAVAGLRQQVSYEGQAAIELEALVDPAALGGVGGYPFAIAEIDGLPRLDPAPMWRELLRDLQDGAEAAHVATRFHAGLADALARMVSHLSQLQGDVWGGRIALSGGVFQNAALAGLLIQKLEAADLTVLRHARVPANDGGLSLGEAVVAAAQAIDRQTRGH